MAKFLIVDDSPIERFTLRTCLNKLGHEVIGEARDGQEALDYYKKLVPDVVILDIILPKENGIQVLEQLINIDKNAKIIMCTSTATQDAVLMAVKLGAKNFLAKPVDMKSLTAILEKILG